LLVLSKFAAGAAGRGDRTINFSRISQPFLKDATKQFARNRLLAGNSVGSISAYISDIAAFSDWLSDHRPGTLTAHQITRLLIEDYMLHVRRSELRDSTKARHIGSLRALIEEQRDDGLTGIARAAIVHAREIPNVQQHTPKGIDDVVFSQLMDERNLTQLSCVQHRTILLLLAHTGFRVSSIVTLPRDCLTIGPDQQPYIRYRNIKLKREAMLPVPATLGDQLQAQEQYLQESCPAGSPYLLPSPRDPDRHISHSALRRILDRYVDRIQPKDAAGNPVAHLHPHLFRHRLGTSMVNDGVPLSVIAKVLDHSSLEMTARYAQIHDDTLRREVIQWHQRVNRRGEQIALPIDGPLGEAAWMKDRIGRAKQALPNGYCGLPLVRTCPHPNACLSCDSFLTDNRFRAQHEQQLDETRRLLEHARERDQVRLVDLLENDEHALTNILTGLDETEATTT